MRRVGSIMAATTLIAIGLAGCAGTMPLPGRAVDAGYVEGGGVFNTGSRLTVRANAFEQDGKVTVCAAWAGDGITAQAKPHVRHVLDTGLVQLGGRNLLHGFSRFPQAPSREAMTGAPAGCVLTRHDWRARDAGQQPRVRFFRLPLDRDEEDGVTLWFMPM